MKGRLALYTAVIVTCMRASNPVVVAARCRVDLLSSKALEDCLNHYSLQPCEAAKAEMMKIIGIFFPAIAGEEDGVVQPNEWGQVVQSQQIQAIMTRLWQIIEADSEIPPSLLLELQRRLERFGASSLQIGREPNQISLNASSIKIGPLVQRNQITGEFERAGNPTTTPMPEAKKFLEKSLGERQSNAARDCRREEKLKTGAKKTVNHARTQKGRHYKEPVIPKEDNQMPSAWRMYVRFLYIRECPKSTRLDVNAGLIDKALEAVKSDSLQQFIKDSWVPGLCPFWSNYKAQSITFMYLLYIVFNILVLQTLSLTNIMTLSGAAHTCVYISLLQLFASILLTIIGLFYNIECGFFFKEITNFPIYKSILNLIDQLLPLVNCELLNNPMHKIVLITFVQTFAFLIVSFFFSFMGWALSLIGISGNYMIVSFIAQAAVFLFLEVVGMHSFPMWVATQSALKGYFNPGSLKNYTSPFFLMHRDLIGGRSASWIFLLFYYFFLQAYTPYLLLVIFIGLMSLRCDDLEKLMPI